MLAFLTPQQRLQADLIWAFTSPDMMQLSAAISPPGLHSIAATPVASHLGRWLSEQDHFQPLKALLQTRDPHRLGIYYEVLWQYIFEQYPGFTLIARNLPVTAEGQTLGEMDFIYYCHARNRYVHLETAVKFYLGLPANDRASAADITGHWANWIGPGRKDRLDLKLTKMLNHQTQLCKTPAGIQTLKRLGVDAVAQEFCLKGYFFYPLSRQCAAPPGSHDQHGSGFWLQRRDMENCLPAGLWCRLDKAEWLSPVYRQDRQDLLETQALQQRIEADFEINPFPLMVVRLQETATGYFEHSRYFITPDDWPNLEPPSPAQASDD